MELDERIKLEIDRKISYRSSLRRKGIFVGSTKEDMMIEDIRWIYKKTEEIGLNKSPYLEYYFYELNRICQAL